MAIKVVDASAVVALLFGEPDAESVAAAFGTDTLAAPALLPLEVASVCLKKAAKDPVRREALLSAFALFNSLGVELVDVGAADAHDTALVSGLSVYDASYLWLARQLDVELVTLDRKLKAAAAASP